MIKPVITAMAFIAARHCTELNFHQSVYGQMQKQLNNFKGYITDFNPSEFMPLKYVGRTDRSNQLALYAIGRVLKQSGLQKFEPHEMGLIVANSLCGINYVEKQARIFSEAGEKDVSKYLSVAFFPCGTAGMASILFNIRGYSTTLCQSAGAGTKSLELAQQIIASGKAKYVLVGGTEAPLIPLFMDAFANRPDSRGSKKLGEASCFFLMESEASAKARQVPILGSVSEILTDSQGQYGVMREILFGNCLRKLCS